MKRLLFTFISLICFVSIVAKDYYWNINEKNQIVRVSVDSYGDYQLRGKTFYIESGDPNISSMDIEFRQYAKLIELMAQDKGARPCTSKDSADLCILIVYGISDQSYVENVPIPIWGPTGIQSISFKSNTQTTGTGLFNNLTTAAAVVSGNTAYGVSASSSYGSVRTETSTMANANVVQSYGVTGYHDVQKKIENYRRVLNVYGYDNRNKDNGSVMLWKTNTKSDGSSSSLRGIFPFLAFVSSQYYGKNTSTPRNEMLLFSDARIKALSKNLVGKDCFNTNLTYDKKTLNDPQLNLDIFSVTKYSDATVVTFFKSGKVKEYGFSKKIKIIADGKEYTPVYSEMITLGKPIQFEEGLRYFSIVFKPIPNDVTKISIVDQMSNIGWSGITIKSGEADERSYREMVLDDFTRVAIQDNLPNITSRSDWEKVFVTEDADWTIDLEDIGIVTGSSMISYDYARDIVIEKMKKEAASLGACVVLVTRCENTASGYRARGVAYKKK